MASPSAATIVSQTGNESSSLMAHPPDPYGEGTSAISLAYSSNTQGKF
jgi:hypothetical protein